MNGIFGNIEVGERFFIRNLVVYPLVYKGDNGLDPMLSLEESINKGFLELEDIYGVNSIGVSNRGDLSVLMIEGESLVGARQDRILNSTAILEPEVETVLPVSCIEQNRWTGDRSFSSSIALAFPSLRSILRSSVSQNLKTKKKREANQEAIWNEVKKTLTITKTKSMTLSMHDAYNSLKDEIERYLEERGELYNIYGYMTFVQDRFVSLDVFSSYDLLKKYERKLFESYAIQGILSRYGLQDIKKTNLSPDNISELDSLKYENYFGVSSGKELRYTGNDILVEVSLDKEERFVYASVLPAPDTESAVV